jgi:hypothetical protein
VFYDRNDLVRALSEIRRKFGDWKPDQLSLIGFDQSHLVEGKNFLGWLRTQDKLENMLLDVLEQYALKSEAIGVNSGMDVLHNVLTGKTVKTIQAIEDEFKTSRYPQKKDLEEIVLARFEQKYHSFLMKILENTEADGNIFLKREHVAKIVLEKMDGYIFNLDSPVKMNFDERNVKCFLIDGFIESVGEIHHILEDLSKSNQPGVLFARNFANDVISTIQHNKKLGRVNLLPIHVRFDFDDLNTLVDLAVIASGDVVSSDKGDLIRMIKTEAVPRLDRVIFRNGKLVVINSSTVSQTKHHLASLKKRATEADEVRRGMLEKRMSSLSTNCLKLSLPIGKQFDEIESIVDTFLRLIRTCMLYGVLEVDGKIVPVTTYLAACIFTKRFTKQLASLGGVMLA